MCREPLGKKYFAWSPLCCEVEFFWEVCVEEGASGLFSLDVVPVSFHALLPDRWSREFPSY